MKRRLVSFILVFAMLCAFVPAVSVYAETYTAFNTAIYNGHTYAIFDESITWHEAKEYCENIGGHLVTITDADEQTFIENLVDSGEKYQYWLGANSESDEIEWVTGEKFDYANWDNGEPNNHMRSDYEEENYIQIYNKANPAVSGSEKYKWNDIYYDNIYPGEEDFFSTEMVGFICEWDYGIYETVKNNIIEENNSAVTVIINNNIINFDYPAIIYEGRTLVPLRGIFETIGAKVDWDNATQTVTSTFNGTTIKMTIGSNILYKNGSGITLDVPAQLIDGYTMVPVRAVAEAFGADVSWDGDSNTVYITTTGNTYTTNSVPQITCDGYDANFANFNGMYIDSFTHKTNDDGSERVSFDVYNTSYIYGFVEAYDSDGNLSNVAVIDKMSNPASIKGVLIDDTYNLIKDFWNSTAFTYKQESGYSKKTSVSIDIPDGGYIKITNDISESLIAGLVNLTDIVFSLKATYSTLSGFTAETSKEYAQEVTLKLLANTAYSELLKDPDKYSEKLLKGISKDLLMNSDSIGDFIDTVSNNIDDLADGVFEELLLSTAKSVGIGIAESMFEALTGPIGTALKAMFSITKVTDVLIEMDDSVDYMNQGFIQIWDIK